MGKFNNKISAEFNPPRKWILERALSYQNEDLDMRNLEKCGVKVPANKITCKKDFVTDLASVPRIAWFLIAPWDVARAAIIHDLLYKSIRQYRHMYESGDARERAHYQGKQPINLTINRVTSTYKQAKIEADQVFLAAMLDAEPSVAKWKIYAAYYAVVLFGRWSIIPNKDNI